MGFGGFKPSSVRVGFIGGIVCLGLFVGQPLTAQPPEPATPEPATPEPATPTVGQISPGTPQPTFTAGVTLVTTDVIVRDRDGGFVPDLTRGDFLVFEDDVQQELESLVLVHGGRVLNQFLPAAAAAPEGVILPSARPTSEIAGRIFILFVDDLHLVRSSTPRVRRVVKQIADNLVHEGDLFGIISTGPSSLAIDMTYDRSMIYDAADRIMGDALTITEMIEGQATMRGQQELMYRGHVAFKTARDVLLNLEHITNRRKVFLYVSNGYDFNPFPQSRLYNDMLTGGRGDNYDPIANPDGAYEGGYNSLLGEVAPYSEVDPFDQFRAVGQAFSDVELGIELAELTRVANRANTSFYTLDPRGLTASPDVNENVPVLEWGQYINRTQNSLKVLAELTGGIAVVNRNDFGSALQRIDAETSDYYIVGYYTNNPDPTMRTRRLRVEIAGREDDDLDVRARTHYSFRRDSN